MWRQDFEAATEPTAATAAALAIARRFGESVRKVTGLQSTGIPVRQRPGHLPKYLLMLFSSDQKAHWDFADQASKAHVDWLYHCDRADYEANVQRHEEHGILELFAAPEPKKDDIDEQLRSEAEEYLPDHLGQLIDGLGSLQLIDATEEAYGEMLGRARVMHLRAAIRHLHERGLIDDDGKGDFWTRTVRWRGAPPSGHASPE